METHTLSSAGDGTHMELITAMFSLPLPCTSPLRSIMCSFPESQAGYQTPRPQLQPPNMLCPHHLCCSAQATSACFAKHTTCRWRQHLKATSHHCHHCQVFATTTHLPLGQHLVLLLGRAGQHVRHLVHDPSHGVLATGLARRVGARADALVFRLAGNRSWVAAACGCVCEAGMGGDVGYTWLMLGGVKLCDSPPCPLV